MTDPMNPQQHEVPGYGLPQPDHAYATQGYPQQPMYQAAAPQPVMPPMSAPQSAAAPAQFGALPAVPPTNAGWAVAALIFFWPLAFSAFTHSSNVFPLWSRGDHAGAQYASDRAKTLGKIALGLCLGFTVLIVIFYVIIIAVAVSNSGDTSSY